MLMTVIYGKGKGCFVATSPPPSISILLITKMTGVLIPCRSSHISFSSSGKGSGASTMWRITSASCKAPLATVSMKRLSLDEASWMPGVSKKRICAEGRVLTPRILCQVVWGLGEMMAIFSPTRRLRRVDLPTLGRPTIGTTPERKSLLGSFNLLLFLLFDGIADETLDGLTPLGPP